jgi:hypothetical protein
MGMMQGGWMYNYHIFLTRDAVVRAGQSFPASDDQEATEIGSVLCDSCSDVVNGFEIWRGSERVAADPSISRTKTTLEGLVAARQYHVVQLEESLASSFECIRRSRRLLNVLYRL